MKKNLFLFSLLLSVNFNFAQYGVSLTISEIMFRPLEVNGQFVEFYNTSMTDTIDLTGFKFKYYTAANNKILSFSGGMKLAPGKYAVILQGNYDYEAGLYKSLIPSDAVILKLSSNNFGSSGMAKTLDRDINLINASGETIDTYIYSADNDEGSSDEKVVMDKNNSKSNWGNSIRINGTPGNSNSLAGIPKYSYGNFLINEIMYEPNAGNSEYIELINITGDTIQIGGMNIITGSDNKVELTNSSLKLAPNEYFVVSADSSIFKNYYWLQGESKIRIAGTLKLLNEGTTIVLKDYWGTTIDSVAYSPAWHNKNIISTKNLSLERLSPVIDSNDKTNWSTCVNSFGGTPGKQNSVFAQNPIRQSKVTVSPNPFSPDNDGFEDFTIINFNLSRSLSQVRIKVFDSQGRLVRTLANNKPSASQNSVIFDGLDYNGRPLRIGIYILLIESVEEGSGKVEVMKTPVVIARKL
jgi:hypothetical protein